MMRDEKLMTVLLAPVISEKSTDLGDRHRTAVFRVASSANKKDIRDAVEKLFEVKVKKVGVSRVFGKPINYRGRFSGRRASWKKAYVQLQAGHDINLSELG